MSPDSLMFACCSVQNTATEVDLLLRFLSLALAYFSIKQNTSVVPSVLACVVAPQSILLCIACCSMPSTLMESQAFWHVLWHHSLFCCSLPVAVCQAHPGSHKCSGMCCGPTVYLAVQTAIGHWSEMFFPLFSILRQEPAFRRPPTQFMLLHLKRVHLMEWARAVMSVALGVKAHEDLPPMMMQQETDSVWTQIRERAGCPFAKHAGGVFAKY